MSDFPSHLFFNGWQPITRTLIVGVLAYIALILLLRVSGKRTLSKFNAFDFIVTVAFGSTLASILLSKDVSLLQGVLAFALLIYLQYLITWSSTRWDFVKRLIKSNPTLLFYNGEYLEDTMKKERFLKEDILAAVREEGFSSVNQVDAVVLETDGTLSIIGKFEKKDRSTLGNVTNESVVQQSRSGKSQTG